MFKSIIDNFRQPRMGLRMLILTVSNIIIGICVANLKMAGFGTDPMSTSSFGLEIVTGIPMGTCQLIINLLCFVPVILWDPGKIGIGTLFNMVFVGYIVQFTLSLAQPMLPPDGLTLTARVILLAVTIVIFLFAVAFYTVVNLGLSSYDAIPLIIADHVRRVPYRLIRILWDVAFVALGFCCGATVGVTTLLIGFCLGPVISLIIKRVTPVLNREK